ncbi:MAG: ATP phosphoribosyltransferase regulatory subunit [Lachnospiraceae bacterium]|nr:ATP phosphoribosyltransferase regulatory subunit [Lachnospiraceae bacterium]
MRDVLLHTPEGVRDCYNSEFERKEGMEHQVKVTMQSYGFHQLMTPTFEYFEIFHKERGTVSSREMYKFVDRDGETLVLRPDMTPQAARCVAKYYKQETMPIRLFYHGSVFVNYSEHQGKLKESTQLGAELYNDSSVEADAEMAALMIDCLRAAGLKKFQVVVGQADFFRALAEEANLTEEETGELQNLIEMKNVFAVEQILSEKEISEELKDIFSKLSTHFGSIETIHLMKQMTKNQRAISSLERLCAFYDVMCDYGKEAYISFDLGMLSRFNYYTGVIFRAYTYGTGDVIAAGGRYDKLVAQFGKEAPAIGIAVYADQIMTALMRQGLQKQPEADGVLLVYSAANRKKAVSLAERLRAEGKKVTLLEKETYREQELSDYAKRNGISEIVECD